VRVCGRRGGPDFATVTRPETINDGIGKCPVGKKHCGGSDFTPNAENTLCLDSNLVDEGGHCPIVDLLFLD